MFTSIMIEGIACIVAAHIVIVFVSLSFTKKPVRFHSARSTSAFLVETNNDDSTPHISSSPVVAQESVAQPDVMHSDTSPIVVVTAHSLLHGHEGHFIGVVR